MVSCAESRKQADYHDSPNRQVLPSISEAIQSARLAHPPLPSPPLAPVAYQPRQLRPGWMPLPSCPTPPKYDYAAPAQHDATINRHLGGLSYQDSLSRISSSSRTIIHCVESYSRIAREQHGAYLIAEKLPTQWEVSDMLSNVELIERSLEHVRDLVQTSIQNERTREGDKVNCFYKGEHALSGHTVHPSSGMTEIKKRRARAVHPGRCHDCNRTNTPEWRRGPDGPRTLCNACGLNYAKLGRKRQLEASSISTKPEEHVV